MKRGKAKSDKLSLKRWRKQAAELIEEIRASERITGENLAIRVGPPYDVVTIPYYKAKRAARRQGKKRNASERRDPETARGAAERDRAVPR